MLNNGTPSWYSGWSGAFLGRIQFGAMRETYSSVSVLSHKNQFSTAISLWRSPMIGGKQPDWLQQGGRYNCVPSSQIVVIGEIHGHSLN